MKWDYPMSRAELKVLNIYRWTKSGPQIPGHVAHEIRWRRILDEVRAEIARTTASLEGDLPAGTADFFSRLQSVVQAGYLQGHGDPSFTAYKITDSGASLLARWKRAGYP